MALITAAEARAYIPGLTGSGEDTALDTLIAQAGEMMARWCGYPAVSSGTAPTMEDQTYTLYGGDSGAGVRVSGARLILPVSPVLSITSIYDSVQWTYGASDLVASGDYVLNGDLGEVYLLPTASHAWTCEDRGLRVVCVAGYSTIPDALKALCGRLVHHLWMRQQAGEVVSASGGGAALAFPFDPVPPEIARGLLPFRLMRGVCS
jgi:hypothetical protein